VWGVYNYGENQQNQTAILLNGVQALSQLSYTPKFSCAVRKICDLMGGVSCIIHADWEEKSGAAFAAPRCAIA
jgi:hypothetical protein